MIMVNHGRNFKCTKLQKCEVISTS